MSTTTTTDPAIAETVAKLQQAATATPNAVKLTPRHGVAGRHATREVLDALAGHDDPGMFGRMFPTLPPLEVSDAKLEALAAAMIDNDPGSQAGNNPNIPGGFTYFGQFIDHDITLDLTSIGDKEKDPLGIENFRTPSVDLDCVYGLGPDGSPHLYARNPADGNKPGPKLLIGKNVNTGERRLPQRPAAQPRRLRADRRSPQRREPAGGADASCDAQVPQQGLRHARGRRHPPAEIFAEARQIVTWHYQWIVLHDWVERLTEQGHRGEDPARRAQVLPLQEDALHAGRVLGGRLPPRPLDGAPALFPQQGVQRSARLQPVLQVLGPVGRHHRRPGAEAGGFATLPSNWIIDWRRFHELGDSGGEPVRMAASRRTRSLSGRRAAQAAGQRRQPRCAICSAASSSACRRVRTSPST